MKLRKKTRQKIKEKRIGSRDKKNLKKETIRRQNGSRHFSFLLSVDSLKDNPGSVLFMDRAGFEPAASALRTRRSLCDFVFVLHGQFGSYRNSLQ